MAAANRLGVRGASVGQAVGTEGGITNDVSIPPRSYLSRLAGEFSGAQVSIPDHDIDEPVDDGMQWCTVHRQYYYWMQGYGCPGCASDEADRQYDSMRDERGREK